MPPKLLIIDDDADIRSQMQWALAQDYEVFVAADRQSALETFRRERMPVVLLDLGLPPHPHGVEEGLQTLSDILQEDALAKVIVVTGREERQHALAAIDQGAYDFFRKPVQIDELKIVAGRALHVYELEREARELHQQLSQEAFEGMLGVSEQMQEVFTAVRRVATTDVPVIISGESGTGKELVARAIHQRSQRCDGPFVPINCGAIPEHLLESELFGHEKGAFTGAHAQRRGRVELAQGGTLFLDEIGELSLPLQVKLLRFLQEHQIERVGGRSAIEIDTRVLAATNIDLKRAVDEGKFREDLYYRLGVVHITLPPLRDRGEDIILLARVLLKRFAAQLQAEVTTFDQRAVLAMQAYAWPGNVRELENRIQRALIMATGPQITPTDLELPTTEVPGPPRTLKEARDEVEKALVVQGLARNNGNVTRTAADLGVSRPTLHDLIAKHGIER
jgi:two-component system NtrC family response regulator